MIACAMFYKGVVGKHYLPMIRVMRQSMTTVTDRRQHPRHVALTNRADLIWDEKSTDEGKDQARILDISWGGAALEAREVPPAGELVWIRLSTPATTPWVSATVLHRDGDKSMGVRFPDGCPEELMLAATLGIALRL